MTYIAEVTEIPELPLPTYINRDLVGLHLNAEYDPVGMWVRSNLADRSLVSRANTQGGCLVFVREAIRALEEAGKDVSAQKLRSILESSFWSMITSPRLWFGKDETKRVISEGVT